MKMQCKDYTLSSSFCWTDCQYSTSVAALAKMILISILIGENIPKLVKSWWILLAVVWLRQMNYGSVLLWNSGHQSQGGLGAGRYMTAVFTHIWFSKWISLSLHYWSESQYNECLPWRWHGGGLILPHFPKWVYIKYSTFCFRDPVCGMSAHVCALSCTYANVCVFRKIKSNKSFPERVELKLWPRDGSPEPLLALSISLSISLCLLPFSVSTHRYVCSIYEENHPPSRVIFCFLTWCIDSAWAVLKIQQAYYSKCLDSHSVVVLPMGKKILMAVLAILITSLLSSCCCWLSSAVSAALKRPPHVPLCYSLSFPLGHSASFILILLFSLTRLILFCRWCCGPGQTREVKVLQ